MTYIRISNDTFVSNVLRLGSGMYIPLSEYQGANVKVKMLCLHCGNIWNVIPRSFVNRGTRCPHCSAIKASNKYRKTDKQFKDEVYTLVNDEYTFLDKYKSQSTKLHVIHNTCGNSYMVTPNNFLRGKRCPFCDKSHKISNDEWLHRFYSVAGNQYIPISNYTNSDTNVEIKHTVCGNTFSMNPYNFLNGRRCPYCAGNHKFSQDEFIARVKESKGDSYIVLGKYISTEKQIKIRHNTCGNTWYPNAGSFLYGTGCPKCSQSHGEEMIQNILEDCGVKYESQAKIGCIDKHELPYDFRVGNFLIEYDGIQHFKPVDAFGGEKSYEYCHRHDLMKTEYANNNGYKLVRIKYTYDSYIIIRDILKDKGVV